ncbi:sigma-70 family RNA polymerase sigma factor [Pollutimonas sp. H1-120]|uniref:sigma-70 family RNA polymerase sigma factor n=1 Tax=Pollutimonas sp. H1-120 TaxID=3148824 RepID=UPI003B51B61F
MAVPPFDYDAALLSCAAGDQNAFQNLYRHEAPRMLALSLKMLGQRSSAEDLVQDAFILIWKNAASYDPIMGSARAWMYSITRYRALGRLRQAGRLRSSDSSWTDTLPGDGASAEPHSVADTIASLDESRRKPLLMAFYNGYNYEQIAARLKTSPGQVRQHTQDALKSMQERQQA